jgi:hypothetical protein
VVCEDNGSKNYHYTFIRQGPIVDLKDQDDITYLDNAKFECNSHEKLIFEPTKTYQFLVKEVQPTEEYLERMESTRNQIDCKD